MKELIKKQLESVEIADLSNYNAETNTFIIPQKKTIKLKENKAYLIYIRDSFFWDDIVKKNWNNGSEPLDRYLKIEVISIMSSMVKVMSIGYDPLNKVDTNRFWSGWLKINDIDIIATL